MCSVQISTGTLAILTDTVRDFYQFLHANAEIVSVLGRHHFRRKIKKNAGSTVLLEKLMVA
jgi:hypothetical protein